MWRGSMVSGPAALLLAAPAVADMPQIEPGRYRCVPGADSSSGIVPLRPGRELRVAFRMMKSSSIRTTLAFIRFDGPKGSSRIAVAKARTDRPRMSAAVNPPGTGVEDPIYYFAITRNWIILKLALDDQGILTVRSNNLSRQFKWGTVSRTTLGCQAGEWEIDVWPRSYVPGSSR